MAVTAAAAALVLEVDVHTLDSREAVAVPVVHIACCTGDVTVADVRMAAVQPVMNSHVPSRPFLYPYLELAAHWPGILLSLSHSLFLSPCLVVRALAQYVLGSFVALSPDILSAELLADTPLSRVFRDQHGCLSPVSTLYLDVLSPSL